MFYKIVEHFSKRIMIDDGDDVTPFEKFVWIN